MESLFKKVAGLMTWNFIKKGIQHRHFHVNFEKFFKKPYLQNTSGCLLVLIAPFQPTFYALITLSSFFLSFFPFISNNCIYYNWFSLLLFPIIYQKINVNVVKTICLGHNLPTHIRKNTDFNRQLPSVEANFEGCINILY